MIITNDDQLTIAILRCKANEILVRGYRLDRKKHVFELTLNGPEDVRAG